MQQEDRPGFELPHPVVEPHRTESQRLRSILPADPVKTVGLLEFTDRNFVAEVLDAKGQLVVFDFWCESCVPCRFLHAVTLRLRDELKTVKFGRVDVDTNPGIVKAFGIRAVPHLAAVLNGEVLFEFVGGRTYEELMERIAPFAGGHNGNGNGNGHHNGNGNGH